MKHDDRHLGVARAGECDGPRAVLEALRERILRRDPDWAALGPEDGRAVLLEVFAEALSELRAAVDGLEDVLLPRLLEAIGEDARWPTPARGAVAFRASGAAAPVRIPPGTVVVASRSPGEPAVPFETVSSAWCGAAQLERVVAIAGEQQREWLSWPEQGWEGQERELWPDGRSCLETFLYLGDAALVLLRSPTSELVLHWPYESEAVAEAEWEVSVHGGWRRVRPDWEETVGGSGERLVAARFAGSVPDLAEREVDYLRGPWLRCRVSGTGAGVPSLASPWWAAATGPVQASGADRRSAVFGFPRPVARTLLSDEGRWIDASGAAAGSAIEIEAAPEDHPVLWLGWDRPESASVFFDFANGQSAVPVGRWRVGGAAAPVLRWEHSAEGGFRPLAVEDETGGLSRSGTVAWEAPAAWAPAEACGGRWWWVRARWVAGGSARPPRLRAVVPHAASVRQGRTVEGRLVETTFDAHGRATLPAEQEEGTPERFDEVELEDDAGGWTLLAAAGARGERTVDIRRHPAGGIVLDVGPAWRGQRTVRFPRLRLIRGRGGDLPAGRVDAIEPRIHGVGSVVQPLPMTGGADPESREAFRRRVVTAWRSGDRAVTAADVRELVAALEPDALRVDVLAASREPGRILVSLVLGPPGEAGRVAPERLRWLEEEVAERAPLGVVVEVNESAWFPVDAILRSAAELPAARSPGGLGDALRRFFDPVRGGLSGRGLPAEGWLEELDLAEAARACGWAAPASGTGTRLELRPAASEGSGAPAGFGALPESWSRPDSWSRAGESAAVVFPVLSRVVFERGVDGDHV